MKTLQITGYGSIEENLAFGEIQAPKLGLNDVLIEVCAAGINPIDYKIVQGAMKLIDKLSFPAPIGYDVSGIVSAKGDGVHDFEIGDAVYSRVSKEQVGTLAEYVVADSSIVANKPKQLNFEEAASIPLVGLTTYQAFEKANLKSGDKILIHAGSGGIGSFAIQYAKYLGAYVYTTTSTTNVDWVKSLGADVVIDYKIEDYKSVVKDIDVVFDTLGGNYTKDAFTLIKKEGIVVSIIGVLDDATALDLGLNAVIRFALYLQRTKIRLMKNKKSAAYYFIFIKPNASQLSEISVLLDKKIIKPIIDRVFDFPKAIEALLYLKSGRAKGKVVVKMK